jgi:hypothetical protein
MAQKIFDKASLVQIPSGYKDGKLYNIKPFDKPFEFSRGSAATRVNEDGLIETFYDEATNLLLQSNQFDTTWTQSGQMLTPVGGQSGYDGSSDAWKIQRSDANGRFIQQTISLNNVQTFSVYAKAGNVDYISMVTTGSSVTRAIFELASDGTGTNTYLSPLNIDSNITHIGGGWYRLDTTIDESITAVQIYPSETSTTEGGSTTDAFIYIQDAQLESGYFATPYIETTTEAVTRPNRHDTPRIDYTNGKALLLEPQRTNLVTHSEALENASSISAAQILNTTDTTPEGSANAKVLAYNGGTNQHYINYTPSVTNGQTYTFSVFLKKKELQYAGLIFLNDFAGQYFDLENGIVLGAIGAGVIDSKIEDYGNGWYRCSITDVATTSTKFTGVYLSENGTSIGPFTPTNTDGIYIYGYQVEEGSYPTSYIPTNGQAETRLADVCQGGGDESTFNDSEGVFYLDGSFSENGRIEITDGTGSDNVVIAFSANPFMRLRANNFTSVQIFGSGELNTPFKIAVKYKSGQTSFWINGVEVGNSSATFSFLNSLNEIRFQNGGTIFYGNVKQIAYFPEALTDTELQTLTTI